VKYAIYSQSLEKFFLVYQGKGLHWRESDFGELAKARLYNNKTFALEMAEGLRQFQPSIVPVQLVADLDKAESVESINETRCAEYLPNVLKIDAMNDKEVDALSSKVWKEYKNQRKFLLDNCTEYNSK